MKELVLTNRMKQSKKGKMTQLCFITHRGLPSQNLGPLERTLKTREARRVDKKTKRALSSKPNLKMTFLSQRKT
jgi:hypothetical protein